MLGPRSSALSQVILASNQGMGISAFKVSSLLAPGYSPFPLLNLQKEYCIYTLYIKEHNKCGN